MSDVKTNVLTKYIADAESHLKAVADMRAAQSKMSAEEKQQAAERNTQAAERTKAFAGIYAAMKQEEAQGRAIQKMIDDVSKAEKSAQSVRSESHGGWIKSLGEIGLAYNTVSGIVSKVSAMEEFAAERRRQTYAAQGVDIGKLTVASHGLATETQLLSDAAAFNSSAIELTSKQMGVAENAMVAATRQGKSYAQAHDAILKAVTTLKVDGLDDLGIHIDKSGLSMDSGADRAELLRRVYVGLSKSSKDVKDGQDIAGDAAAQAGVKMTNAWDDVKTAVGELAESLTPLLTGLAKAVSLIAELLKKTSEYVKDDPFAAMLDLVGPGGFQNVTKAIGKAHQHGLVNAHNVAVGIRESMPDGLGTNEDMYGGLEGDVAGFVEDINHPGASYDPNSDAPKKGVGNHPGADGGLSAAQYQQLAQQLLAQSSAMIDLVYVQPMGVLIGDFGKTITDMVHGDYAPTEEDNAAFDQAKSVLSATYLEPLQRMLGQFGETVDTITKMEGGPTAMEKVFGTRDELQKYREAWEGVTAIVTAGYNNMIDGTESFGTAVKHSTADALKALGAKYAVQSIAETAEGLGSLFVNPAGAAAHFASAAEFAAAAVAAGVGAKAIGTTAAAANDAKAAKDKEALDKKNKKDADKSEGDGSNRPIVIIATSTIGESDRMKQSRIQKELDAAMGSR